MDKSESAGPSFEEKKVLVDDSFADIVPWFLDNRKEDLRRVKEFVEVSDFEQIQRMGHRWKGTCASYGFLELSKAGELLEDLSVAKRNEDILKLLDSARQYINNVEVVYVPASELSF